MAIPPTLNDLNRLKSNLVNPIRRFPIATKGENFIDIKLNSFQMPDVIGVDLTNSLAFSGDISFSPFNLNTGDFILNTISENNTIFSPGSIEVSRNIGGDKVTDSPNNVLYYQDTKPIEVSNNFIQSLPDEDFTIRVSFYNEENFKESTTSYPVSVINFDETDKSKLLKVPGSLLNTNVFTISTDYINNNSRRSLIALKISLLDKNNKRFLQNYMLLTEPVSVFKDDVFLTSINTKYYPNMSESRPLTATDLPYKGSLTNNARCLIFSKNYFNHDISKRNPLHIPLSASGIVEDLKTNPIKAQGNVSISNLSGIEDYKYSLGAYKNLGLEDGVILYDSFLSAGNYEFKFNIKDQDTRFNNNNISTTITLSVVEVEKDMLTPSLSTIVRAISSNPVYTPGNYNHLRLFTDTAGTEPVTWNTDFWAYSARDIFNFSGIHWKGNANATLITPRHAVCAEHWRKFGAGKKVGDILYFYDHTTGNPVSALIDGVLDLDQFELPTDPYDYHRGNNYRSISAFFDIDDITNTLEDLSGSKGRVITDCTLVHLDRDVVSGNDIKAYPLAKKIFNDYGVMNTSSNPEALKYPAIMTGGRPRQTQGDNVGIGHIRYLSDFVSYPYSLNKIETPRPTAVIGPDSGNESASIRLSDLETTNLSSIFTNIELISTYSFGSSIGGDSGNPNFVILDNQLGLVSTNTTGGPTAASGPDFTNAGTQVVLQSAIDIIGNTEGYQLSTIDMV